MNCFDCATDHRDTKALGVCLNCGAGVCADHVELDAHEEAHLSGPGNYTPMVTRRFTCTTCATVLHSRRKTPGTPARG